ncbi:MAG: hydrogen gas-evolving membrane-bound hydrogenase subunit E [Oscillospiraceae bacterium]
MSNLFVSLKKFVDGDFSITTKRKPQEKRRETTHKETTIKERLQVWHDTKAPAFFKGVYITFSVCICLSIILILLITVSYLPPFGNPSNPVNNEVSQRYIEKGLEETGAVNIVAGMILDYRAFDTFGESAVLFVAACSVMLLMQNEKKGDAIKKESEESQYIQVQRDPIVKNIAKFIIPFLLIFGIYIVLNGHLSPGGGFSGGAIMGASLILYSSAYGYRKISKVVTEKLIKRITFCSLIFYACAKGYSFFTGANHLLTGIPLGTPGAILSSGLILPLNICVGLIVTCTMYSFYSLFSKGEI